jgi:hypothetical protein
MKLIERDENGLLNSTEYTYTEEGLIDWRKMISPEFLVANKDRTSESDVTKLKDYELIILLGGIKQLAQIRGYTDVTYDISSPSSDYVVATCSIKWIPNYETEGREVVFSSVGDASPQNTKSFAKFFLGPIAENRAFVRCVRNFLKINIVAQEELGNVKVGNSSSDSSTSLDPRSILEELMKEKGISFDKLKTKLSKEKYKGDDELNSLEDISKIKVFELIERIRKINSRK